MTKDLLWDKSAKVLNDMLVGNFSDNRVEDIDVETEMTFHKHEP